MAASAWGCRSGAPPGGVPAPPKASSTGQPTAKTGKGELLIGQSAPFSGPSAQLGREYREGAMAWFTELNRRGGIHGRQLKLLSLDDRYEPDLTLVNTQRLIGTEQVFLLFGYVGTPTVKAVLPMIEQANIPMVAPLTGARLMREPSQQLVFNLRASYQSEIDRMVDSLVRMGRHRIAVLHQNDAFGDDGLRSTRAALARHGLKPVAIAGVERNSTKTDAAAHQIQQGKPNAVVVISAYPSSAAFSQSMNQLGSTAQLMNVSFVGTSGLQDSLTGGQANGIGISQVVPFPWDRRVPVVAEYQRLMRRQQATPKYGYTSLEGFLAARLLGEALQRAGAAPSRQAVVAAFESMKNVDLGGFQLNMGPGDHQASDFVDLTFLGSQRWGP
ncbi:ABC transporter substrate-binding protein [Synechococcus sp. LA31]|nr:ABC transporter substrate-binding protein [Synechococcus sp. LA31]